MAAQLQVAQLPIAQLPVESPTEDKPGSLNDASTLEDGVGSAKLIEKKSKGVVEMEQLEERINRKWLILLYGGFLILAYTLSLNQFTAGFFLNAALSVGYKAHALQSTINTITAVFQAMSQPPIAKAADVFGRVKAYIGCVILYVVGYIIVAASNSIYMYAVGNSIYIIGITGLFLLQNIIISDISSLRNRYFWTIFPSVPSAINTWVGGDVIASFLGTNGEKYDQWRWGYGMYCILVPVLATPIIVILWRGTRLTRVRRVEYQANKAAHKRSFKASCMSIFWQLDFIGLLLFVGGFGMVFVTFTLANSRTSKWSDAQTICLLVFGFVLIIAFGLYERFYAPHPLLPFKLIKRKTVIGCVLIALIHPMAGRIVGQYFVTFLVVAGGQTTKSAQRLSSLPSFAATIVAILAAAVTHWTRRLKPVILLGLALQTLGFGLMIRFRTSTNSISEIVVVQLLKGCGIGMISFPTQAVIQSAAPHEHLGAITAAYLVVFYMSSGIGASIGGAIWTNTVPRLVGEYMGNDTLAASAYADPLGFAVKNPYGTPARQAIARAQDEAQRLIVIVGTCVCAVALITSFFLIDNVRLPDTQSLEESEVVDEAAEARRAKLEHKVIS